LLLVYVHAEVFTNAPLLTTRILSHLVEQMSLASFKCFQAKMSLEYLLAGLMQATLDVEPVAQTTSQYTTKPASATQSEFYIQLDQGTTPDSSKRLQAELPGMRQVLLYLSD